MDETGPASDQSDPDSDGIPNLVKFALGSHPKEPTPAPGTLVRNGSTPAGTAGRGFVRLRVTRR